MLAVQDIEVTYHNVITAVRGVSLEVPDGSIVAILAALPARAKPRFCVPFPVTCWAFTAHASWPGHLPSSTAEKAH